MNKIVILFCLIVSIGFSEVPDVIMKDIQGKEYNVHALLAEGKHIAFYMLSKT